MRRTIRSTILSTAVLAVCAACSAGSPSVKSPEDAEASAARLKTEYQAWLDQYSAFRGRADATIVDGDLLRNHPGWPEMEKIVRAWPALRRFEGEPAAHQKTAKALVEWGQRWNSSGENILRHYETLVERSRLLEIERVQLLQQRHEVFQRAGAVIMQQAATARRAADIQMDSAILQGWAKLRDEDLGMLNEYGLGALGLYQHRSR